MSQYNIHVQIVHVLQITITLYFVWQFAIIAILLENVALQDRSLHCVYHNQHNITKLDAINITSPL